MALPFLLIDGYNLLHAAGMARRRYGPGDLARCRSELLNHLLIHLPDAQRERTTIVFDARAAPADLSRSTDLHGMRVVFADAGGDADTHLEELLAGHSAPRLVLMVSSDHRLQKAARRRRARFVDSEVFHARLESQGPRPESDPSESDPRGRRDDPKHGGVISEKETAAWLEEFGSIPEADKLQSDAEIWQRAFDDITFDEED